MKSSFKALSLQTKDQLDIIDITNQIKEFVEQSNIENGIVNIQTLHTTATVIINENEPLLLKDFKDHLQKIAPNNAKYNHDNFEIRTVNMCEDECANGHAHCKALHLTPSVCLNIKEKKLQLGTWQRIMFIELDQARPRKVQVQILGE